MQLIKKRVCTRIAPSIMLQNAEGSYFVFINQCTNTVHTLSYASNIRVFFT